MSPAQASEQLKLVSWNVEHLAEKNGQGCRSRNDDDYEQLRRYAKTLEADVVALQEVESIKAVHRVFPAKQWDVIISERPNKGEPRMCREGNNTITPLKVAIAIRKGVDYSYDPGSQLSELGLANPNLRHGVVVKLNHTQPATSLLAVHLKSGCYVNDLQTSDKESCQTLNKQLPIFDGWVETQLKQGTPFVVMGDFNHRLNQEGNSFWQVLATMDGQSAPVRRATLGRPSCHPRFKELIDHVLVGPLTEKYLVADSAQVHYFGKLPGTMDYPDMLSDHCPISIDLYAQPPQAKVDPSVQFTRVSKEYQAQTLIRYQTAQQQLANRVAERGDNPKPWVVFMDVDETVLDNSGYQLQMNQQGASFSPQTWSDWVAGRYARKVPGAQAFIDKVTELGGKVAFITNRNRSQDKYTWANLIEQGFEVTRDKMCILGRTADDKAAVEAVEKDSNCTDNESGLLNDKDLRRTQVLTGKATACWQSDDFASDEKIQAAWQQPFDVLMEVGDNIQDFTGFRQQCAAPEALSNTTHSSRNNDAEYILLPNAMYGSWGRLKVQ